MGALLREIKSNSLVFGPVGVSIATRAGGACVEASKDARAPTCAQCGEKLDVQWREYFGTTFRENHLILDMRDPTDYEYSAPETRVICDLCVIDWQRELKDLGLVEASR